jgi:sugar lactone lactonase YvrE
MLEALEDRSLPSIQVAPGYVYGPTDLGVRQWTPDLQVVGDQRVLDGPYGMAGAAITPDGLFLTCAYETGSGVQEGDHLIALGPDGGTVHDLYLTNVGLNRDSGIAVDASGQIFVSSPLGVHVVAPDFSTQALLPVSFGRAAGIAIDGQGEMYVVDQANDQIAVLDQDHQVLRYIPTGRTPRQDAIGPDGNLYYTDEPYRSPTEYLSRLVQVDIGQGDAQAVVLSGLPYMNSITFAPDGSFYLGTSNGRALSWYSPDGQLLAYVEHGSAVVDAVAYYPPDGGGSPAAFRVPWGRDADLAGTLGAYSAAPGAEPGPPGARPAGEFGPYPDGAFMGEGPEEGELRPLGGTPRGRGPEFRGRFADDGSGAPGAGRFAFGGAGWLPVAGAFAPGGADGAPLAAEQ